MVTLREWAGEHAVDWQLWGFVVMRARCSKGDCVNVRLMQLGVCWELLVGVEVRVIHKEVRKGMGGPRY